VFLEVVVVVRWCTG